MNRRDFLKAAGTFLSPMFIPIIKFESLSSEVPEMGIGLNNASEMKISRAGIYNVFASIRWLPAMDGATIIELKKHSQNSSSTIGIHQSIGGDHGDGYAFIDGLCKYNPDSDWIELTAYQKVDESLRYYPNIPFQIHTRRIY